MSSRVQEIIDEFVCNITPKCPSPAGGVQKMELIPCLAETGSRTEMAKQLTAQTAPKMDADGSKFKKNHCLYLHLYKEKAIMDADQQ